MSAPRLVITSYRAGLDPVVVWVEGGGGYSSEDHMVRELTRRAREHKNSTVERIERGLKVTPRFAAAYDYQEVQWEA